MKEAIQRFWEDEDGATAIEYGLIAGLIAVVIIGGATAVGTELQLMFCKVATKLKGSAASCTAT